MGGRFRVAVVVGLALVVGTGSVWAACNLIPGTVRTFNGALGTTNRPFAAPGERLEVGLRNCDTASNGISTDANDHLVTVVFTPPGATARNAIVLTPAADCSAVAPKLAACQAQLGGGTATCVAAPTSGVSVVTREGSRFLSFVFPDTDDRLGTPTKASITVKGKGDFLQMPALDLLASPITVQLTAASGACWEAVYSAPFQTQTALQLKAKAD